MFGLFALIYIPYMLIRVAFMVLRAIGMVLVFLARIALNAQKRRQLKRGQEMQHVRIKVRKQRYPTFGDNKTKIFI